MIEVIPAIAPKNFQELKDKTSIVAGHVRHVHIDVTDSTLTRRSTWPYGDDKSFFDEVRTEAEGLPHWEELSFEVHLMVREPQEILHDWMRAGAERVVVHYESDPHVLDKIHKETYGLEVGLAVNLDTPLEKVMPEVMKADFVHLMSISEIGEPGHPFNEKIFGRIEELRREHPAVVISVDGGVNLENADDLMRAGVSRLVVSSAIFGSKDPLDTLEDFLEIAHDTH